MEIWVTEVLLYIPIVATEANEELASKIGEKVKFGIFEKLKAHTFSVSNNKYSSVYSGRLLHFHGFLIEPV